MGKIITVDFRQDTLFAVERDDGVFIAVTPICDALGLDAKRQRDRIQRDVILSEGGAMMALPSAGGMQETFCLRLDLVHGWLFTIDDSRVKDDTVRQKVLSYKRECYGVLFQYFHGKAEQTVLGRNDNEPKLDGAAERSFPDWPMEELRTKRGVVDMYRLLFGVPAGQWVAPKMGFPLPPKELITHGGQPDLFQWNKDEAA